MREGTLVTVCKDGLFSAKTDIMTHVNSHSTLISAIKTLDKQEIKADINCFLVQKEKKNILIDAGVGEAWGEHYGHARQILRSAHVSPDDIHVVLLTHIHHDHVLGLFQGDKAFFPNATIIIPKAEYVFHNENYNSYTPLLQKIYEIYGKSKIQLIDYGELFEGIVAYDLSGHTVGHTGYLIDGTNERYFFAGDVCHLANLQLHDTNIGVIYDHDIISAAKSRYKALELSADHGWIFAGSHMPNLFKIKKHSDKTFTALNYG